jgi:hypothetical protein
MGVLYMCNFLIQRSMLYSSQFGDWRMHVSCVTYRVRKQDSDQELDVLGDAHHPLRYLPRVFIHFKVIEA